MATSEYVKFDMSGETQQTKREFHSGVSSSALSFVTFVTQMPPLADWKSFILFITLRGCFFLYALFFLVFGIVECLQRFTDYFWLLHITMMTKLIVLGIALSYVKERLEWQSSLKFLRLMDASIPFGKTYFTTTTICNVCSMAFYYVVWADEFMGTALNVAIVVVFVSGTLAYTLFSTCVLMISITDAKMSFESVQSLVTSSKYGNITSDEYSNVYEEIRDTVNKGFYLNGSLMMTMMSNTVAAIVLMLQFRVITDGENSVHVVSFTVYVLVVQWATDVVFLYKLLPEISSVNELAMQLHVITAHQRWVEDEEALLRSTPEHITSSVNGASNNSNSRCEDDESVTSPMDLTIMEANRYDTLHRIIAQPIRYTIASIYFTKKGARNQLFGVVGAVIFSFVRVIVSLMLD